MKFIQRSLPLKLSNYPPNGPIREPKHQKPQYRSHNTLLPYSLFPISDDQISTIAVNLHDKLFRSPYSRVTIHGPPFRTHNSRPTTHNPQFSTHYSQPTIADSLFTAQNSRPTVPDPLFSITIHNSRSRSTVPHFPMFLHYYHPTFSASRYPIRFNDSKSTTYKV